MNGKHRSFFRETQVPSSHEPWVDVTVQRYKVTSSFILSYLFLFVAVLNCHQKHWQHSLNFLLVINHCNEMMIPTITVDNLKKHRLEMEVDSFMIVNLIEKKKKAQEALQEA